MIAEVTFLGTGGSAPTKARGLPSMAVEYDGEVLLFDCGEGTQRQAMLYSVNMSKIRAIFITHTHGDHIMGVAGLVRTMALNKHPHPLFIYVPEGETDKIRTLITFDRALIGYEIVIKEVRSGTVYRGKGFSVSAFRLNHKVPAYGYAFKEDDRRRFMKDKIAKLGLKGEEFSKFQKKGTVTVGGRTVRLEDVTFKVGGIKIVYATDTRPCASTVKAAKGADVLVHEATYSEEELDLARRRFHSTAAEASAVAKKAGCKKLFLFHISARYSDPGVLLNEAKPIFRDVEVAEDGTRIKV